MAERKQISRLSKSTCSSEWPVIVGGMPFALDRDLLASKCSRLCDLAEDNSHDTARFFHGFPADAETFELVARFCHGYEVQMCTENVVPLICAAAYLGMDESHSQNNLFSKAANFFQQRVLPSWDKTIKAFRVTERFLEMTMQLGIFDACLDSIAEKVLRNYRLLGEPLKSAATSDDSDEDDNYRPNARRKLFDVDWNQDLTMLPLPLYEPVIRRMSQNDIPLGFIASSVCQYASNWVFSCDIEGESLPVYKRNFLREVIEALENLLPQGTGFLPCTFLFRMLQFATACDASAECRTGLETRIGRQLHQATVRDLLMPSQGYAKEVQYDVECVRRILSIFYSSQTGSSSDMSSLIAVAQLIEEFLADVASDIDLKVGTFVSLAEMSAIASSGSHRNSDGVYRAIDIYLDKHRFLTEHEKEEVCKVLDCQKLSPEAFQHAARNEKLPMRIVVQVLFEVQLQMRDTISKDVHGFVNKLRRKEVHNEKGYDTTGSYGGEGVITELEKMTLKVRELEKECYLMKKEISSSCNENKMKKGKLTIWREVKRKLGCMTTINDCNSQVKKKKVHPKYSSSSN